MKAKAVILSVLAVPAMIVACAQTPQERIKAYETAHEEMMKEYRQTMDSLSADREKAEAFYNEFVERYIKFNLDAA